MPTTEKASKGKSQKGDANKTAMYLAILGGVCLVLSGINGAAAWSDIKDVVERRITLDSTSITLMSWLLWLANLGGFAVIAGGIAIGGGMARGGKVAIMLGAGIGLIGLTIALLSWVLGSPLLVGGGSMVGIVGIFLSVIARKLA